jgi:translation initiation factor 1 (eIF-1/SUI1)
VGKQVPVYTHYSNGRTRALTVVRKISGDTRVLMRELYRLTGGAKVTERQGSVEVEGDRREQIKSWLMGLGF